MEKEEDRGNSVADVAIRSKKSVCAKSESLRSYQCKCSRARLGDDHNSCQN